MIACSPVEWKIDISNDFWNDTYTFVSNDLGYHNKTAVFSFDSHISEFIHTFKFTQIGLNSRKHADDFQLCLRRFEIF